MASLSRVKWGAISVTSAKCWFHFFTFPWYFFLKLYLWFYTSITHIFEILTVKIKKTNKQKIIQTYFTKK